MNNLNAIKPLRPGMLTPQQQVEGAEEVRDVFRQFVGEAFFGQMLKSMRSTQGKAAYFHGGHGEEVFQSQLDQVLSEEMTESSADQIADPMFRQQFPQQAAVLAKHEANTKSSLEDLTSLRRW
ncbi:rod-binding protein [Bythopirellula polymerisocia]|nr:rod-binding protein [Bythopirellula polymerisocia]